MSLPLSLDVDEPCAQALVSSSAVLRIRAPVDEAEISIATSLCSHQSPSRIYYIEYSKVEADKMNNQTN